MQSLTYWKTVTMDKVLGLPLPVARVEDVLQGKVWAFQDSQRRASKRQKDLTDITRILEPYPHLRANNLFYYEEGNPRVFVSPDVYVVKGVSGHDRRIYKLWEEGVAPCVVFEITSRSTRGEGLGDKRALYEMLGVQEYFLFDPEGDYLNPQLQGFRLLEDFYTPIPHEQNGAVYSEELDLVLRPEDHMLRIFDPETGQALPTLDEAVEEIAEALERAEVEAQRAQAEAQRAQAEAERAQAEAQRADNAEAQVARLRAELEQMQRHDRASKGSNGGD